MNDKASISSTNKGTRAYGLLMSYLLAFGACTLIFSLLLAAAYAIPVSLMEENLESSANTLSEEGQSYSLAKSDSPWLLGNFTTVIMLNMAGHTSEKGLVYSVFSSPRYSANPSKISPVSNLSRGVG